MIIAIIKHIKHSKIILLRSNIHQTTARLGMKVYRAKLLQPETSKSQKKLTNSKDMWGIRKDVVYMIRCSTAANVLITS
jgi:hypothetical protein